MSDHAPTVLLIEDDPQIRRYLRAALPGHGYHLLEAETGQEGITQAATRTPDVVLLDLGLPDQDGLEVIGKLREWSKVPIIVLSARGLERDKVQALDAGADDYLTKPFGVEGAVARSRVALRHAATAGGESEPLFETGELHVDLAARRVLVGAKEVHLTPTEFKLPRDPRSPRGKGRHAPPASPRGMGTRFRVPHPLPARADARAAAQARGRRRHGPST
jgi:two-component system KDP operon response regulator KdpE